jgi:hydroxyacylglutathione hydrolase
MEVRMSFDYVLVPCRSDNYAVLVHDPASGATAIVDTPDGDVIDAELTKRGWRPTHILTTHHHGDHTAGHAALKAKYGLVVISPQTEADKVPGTDVTVREGSELSFAGQTVEVFDTPGHTRGHIAFYLPGDGVLFAGDTLFALGCGRLLEDGPAAMWSSLSKLAKLPPATRVYCGHEYTLSNARFALAIEPSNPALAARAASVEEARAAGRPTVPSTIGEELATNPFVRANLPEVKQAIGMTGATDVAVFAEIRKRKDNF